MRKSFIVPTFPLESNHISADACSMFLRAKKRIKEGKAHRYWSIIENRRVVDDRIVQRQVLYLVHIPAHVEQPFRFNLNTYSGLS